MIEWITTPGLVHYDTAIAEMERRIAAIRAGTASEAVWLLQHPPLYTAGTSAKAEDLLHAQFPVHQTGRGGQYTYHGPGQRIAYVMLDLAARANGKQADVRKFVWQLEEWIIQTLSHFGVRGERRAGRIGIWVITPPPSPGAVQRRSGAHVSANDQHGDGLQNGPRLQAGEDGNSIAQEKKFSALASNSEAKIAAIGVRVTRGVTWHGVSINIDPDLSHYDGIIPCGIEDFGVTSLHEINPRITMPEVDAMLQKTWDTIFQK